MGHDEQRKTIKFLFIRESKRTEVLLLFFDSNPHSPPSQQPIRDLREMSYLSNTFANNLDANPHHNIQPVIHRLKRKTKGKQYKKSLTTKW